MDRVSLDGFQQEVSQHTIPVVPGLREGPVFFDVEYALTEKLEIITIVILYVRKDDLYVVDKTLFQVMASEEGLDLLINNLVEMKDYIRKNKEPKADTFPEFSHG